MAAGTGRRAIAIFAAAVIVVMVGTVGFLSLSSTGSSSHTTTETAASGIQLLASANETSIRAGQRLAVTATLFNPSGENYDVSTGSHWPFNGLLMLSKGWPYCYFYSPFELLVLKGNFSVAGVISTVNSIGPNTTSGMFCYENEDLRSFNFEPTSSLASVASIYSETGNASVAGPQNASVTVSVNGYWDNNTLLYLPASYTSTGNYSFLEAQHPFAAGVYTIAVGDEWGQVAILHLIVSDGSPAQSAACDEQVPPGVPLRMNGTGAPVFHITSTKAVICVLYKFEGAQTTNFTTRVEPWYQTGASLSDAQCSATDCPTVTASPSSAYHGVGGEVAVAYTISSPVNLSGLFLVFHPGCSPFVLAIGPMPSSVYNMAWTCGPVNAVSSGYRSINYNVTGVTNVEILAAPWT